MDSKSAVCTTSMHCIPTGNVEVNDTHFKNSQGLTCAPGQHRQYLSTCVSLSKSQKPKNPLVNFHHIEINTAATELSVLTLKIVVCFFYLTKFSYQFI